MFWVDAFGGVQDTLRGSAGWDVLGRDSVNEVHV